MLSNPTPSVPIPFFEDTRSIAEKLTVEKKEWRPHQPERGCPETIFGLVLERDQYASPVDGEVHETARVLSDGNVEWSIIGFHGFLQGEFRRKNPRVGDFVAIAFRGTKPARNVGENDPYVYVMEVERNPAAPVVALRQPVAEAQPGAEATVEVVPPELGDADIPW